MFAVQCILLYIMVQLLDVDLIYLANPSLLFVKFGAYHVNSIEVFLPYVLALKAELRLLRGLLQHTGLRLVVSSSAPASDGAVDVGWNFPISLG